MVWLGRCRLLVPALLILSCSGTAAQADRWTFDAAELGGEVSADTVNMFNAGGQPPGVYHVDVYLNEDQVDEADIRFDRDDSIPDTALRPCLNPAQLTAWGVRLKDDGRSVEPNACMDLHTISTTARVEYDFAGQRLLLKIPQADLVVRHTGEVPVELWNDGVPAFLLGWQGDVNRVKSQRGNIGEQLSRFVRLTPGINVGPWRLRNATSWEKNHGAPGRWLSGYTRLERGFYTLRSRLTLGESTTPADVFDSIPFTGVMVGTDDAMSAPGESSYTPVIRGIARTQARVVVRLNGDTLYIREVPPGPFALDNLPVPGAGGVLEVSVEESSGDVQHFNVPWQTPAIALHEGYIRYNLMAGHYSMDGLPSVPAGQFTIMSGLPGSITLYGGVQQSERYFAMDAGLGVSMGAFGSLSADITRATHREGDGNALRVRYSKSIGATDTQVSLELNRYSSGYRTLSESVMADSNELDMKGQRQSMALSLAQPLGNAGNLSVSTSTWRDDRASSFTRTGVLSYSVVLSGVTMTLNWARNGLRRGHEWKIDRTLALGLSFPLGQSNDSPINAMLQASRSASQGESGQATLSGQGKGGQLSWTATGSISRSEDYRPGNRSATLMAGWRDTYGKVTGHYGQNTWSEQSGAGLSGGLVLTQYGMASGQDASGTLALVTASGAEGTVITGHPGLKTNAFGQALMPATPYRKNGVRLDALSLGSDTELMQSEVQVIPTQGAVVPAVFKVRKGGRGLVILRRPSGKPVPFGAVVSTMQTQQGSGQDVAGIVGEGGLAFLTGLSDQGILNARWGRASTQQCSGSWRLPAKADAAGLWHVSVTCG